MTLHNPPWITVGNNFSYYPLQKEQDKMQGGGKYHNFPSGGSKGLSLQSANTDSRQWVGRTIQARVTSRSNNKLSLYDILSIVLLYILRHNFKRDSKDIHIVMNPL